MAIILTAVLVVGLGLSNFSLEAEAAEEEPYQAEFLGITALSETDLYNATNTYQYKGIPTPYQESLTYTQTADNAFYYTDNNHRTGLTVSQYAPRITVLTHGLGCNASVWSNNEGAFSKDTESLIERLNQKQNNKANIYLAKFKQNSDNPCFRLAKLFQLFNGDDN